MLTVLTQMPPFFSGNSEWTYGHPDGPSRRPFGISQGYFWVRVMSAPKKEVPIDHARASSHLAMSCLCARCVELGEGIPERSVKCASSPTRISLARRVTALEAAGHDIVWGPDSC